MVSFNILCWPLSSSHVSIPLPESFIASGQLTPAASVTLGTSAPMGSSMYQSEFLYSIIAKVAIACDLSHEPDVKTPAHCSPSCSYPSDSFLSSVVAHLFNPNQHVEYMPLLPFPFPSWFRAWHHIPEGISHPRHAFLL